METFRWAFIGAGTLAGQVAKQLKQSGRHEIVSVYTRKYDKCEAFAKAWGARPAESDEEAIAAPDVDAVYVVTPHNSHFDYARQALEMGKPVLCEKPMTVSAREAEALIRLSREKNTYLAEAMWTWFSPIARQVKAWVDKGAYGGIQAVHAHYHLHSIGYAPRVSDPRRAGGALLDVGVYPVAYLYRLFGMPEKIRCRGELQGGIDLKEDIELTFPQHLTCTASASIVDWRGLERLTIQGDKARTSLFFFHSAGKVKLKRPGQSSLVARGDGSLLNEFDRVAQEIRDGRTESEFVPLRATLDVMRILDECRRQMGLVYPFEQRESNS